MLESNDPDGDTQQIDRVADAEHQEARTQQRPAAVQSPTPQGEHAHDERREEQVADRVGEVCCHGERATRCGVQHGTEDDRGAGRGDSEPGDDPVEPHAGAQRAGSRCAPATRARRSWPGKARATARRRRTGSADLQRAPARAPTAGSRPRRTTRRWRSRSMGRAPRAPGTRGARRRRLRGHRRGTRPSRVSRDRTNHRRTRRASAQPQRRSSTTAAQARNRPRCVGRA